jgi:hypothetical protein
MFSRSTQLIKTKVSTIYTIPKRFSSNGFGKNTGSEYKYHYNNDRYTDYATFFTNRSLRAFGGLVGALSLNSKLEGKTDGGSTAIGGLIGYIAPGATIIFCGTPMIAPYIFGPKSSI